MVNEISWTRNGLRIRGAEYLPEDFEDQREYKAVILCHGFLGNYTDLADFAHGFAGLGFVSYCFSFCGGSKDGTPGHLKSDGSSTDMSVLTEVEDLLTVIDGVRKKSYIEENGIILMGFSQGGFVSGLAAARCPEAVEKLIMVYPALCIPDHARRGCLGGASYSVEHVPEVIDCGEISLGKAFHEEMAAFDPYRALAPYAGSVLIMHGTEDGVVDYSYSVRAMRNYRKGQCTLQLIRGMGHGQNKEQQESIFKSARYFLEGRREILTLRIIITHYSREKEGEIDRENIYFTGYCESDIFTGTIIPEGCDARETEPGKEMKIRAEYTLQGIDAEGKNCSLHIVNTRRGDEWKPVITTEHPALRWLNDADLSAVLEYSPGGPTVRIYGDRFMN